MQRPLIATKDNAELFSMFLITQIRDDARVTEVDQIERIKPVGDANGYWTAKVSYIRYGEKSALGGGIDRIAKFDFDLCGRIISVHAK